MTSPEAGGRYPRVRARGELTPPAGCDALISVGVAIDGPVAVWSSKSGERLLHESDNLPGGASFPRSRPMKDPPVSLASYDGQSSIRTAVSISELPVAFPHVDRFPDGSFLLVGSRCRWTEAAGPEANAIVVDSDGSIARLGCLGDGLEHVHIAEDGLVWTGYFDEGIFGNFGWGGPHGPTPLGAAGIVAWSAGLEKVWELDPIEGLVSDCYALNATVSGVLACVYTDFPVIHIADRQEQVYPTEDVSGPRGILATADRVALIGTYKDPSLLVVGRLAEGRFVEESRLNLWGPDGAPLPEARVHCRGQEAHFFAGSTWYSFDLRDLP
jgi:hypothetical protein